MTTSARRDGEHVAWEGTSSALAEIRDVLIRHDSTGALRIVLQQLLLREDGREVGRHEVIDVVTDVDGNLVALPIAAFVRAEESDSARLDAALARLREDISAQARGSAGTVEPLDSLEVILDGDGQERVRTATGLRIAPEQLRGHPALHGGAHHIHHDAPALDELRDRLAGPPSNLLQRSWNTLRSWARGEA